MEEGIDDPALEFKFCLAAIPAMLALAVLFHLFMPFLQRTFLAMPVHELGHAVAAWFCGYWAIPTLWHTNVAESRGFVMPVLLGGALIFFFYRALRSESYLIAAGLAALLVVQTVCTFFASVKTTQMLIVFGGDGVGMMLAALLMGSFYFGRDTQLYQGSLRWGFVAIGAAAWVDFFSVWLAAKRDPGRIPFGEQEGVGLSDATKLVDDFGWTADQMVRRFLVTGLLSLAAVAAVYAWGAWRAWREAQEA